MSTKKKRVEPLRMPPIQPPPFATKHLACEAGYSVQPMQSGGFAVFARGARTTMRHTTERGTWSLIVRAA